MVGGRLPVVNGKRVIQALTKAGFVVNRIVGSHHVVVYPGDPTRTVTVPVHAGRDLKPGTLRSIIRQTGLTVEEFTALL
jgi:predicted RNA binding protein YcfA (HicA-like mRNA interferase family)